METVWVVVRESFDGESFHFHDAHAFDSERAAREFATSHAFSVGGDFFCSVRQVEVKS